MALVIPRREDGLCERQSKTLRGELENNSRKQRDLTENSHSDSIKKGQHTLSQGKMKKGDDVADDDDDAVVRTSVTRSAESYTVY